ncbi:TlpA disulfide reductase family protein [Phenylobacterium sp.]|jgi:thiol-disulfide isomerase/thioredoxin|uniref:TlpA family protein disulfide reductase n=1 Tax=Phenylobacterium sp. TaxID=1871053 RepID=UPI002F95B217
MSDQSGARPRGGLLKWALWGAALLGVAAVLYIMAKASSKPEPEIATGPKPAAAAPAKSVMEKFELPEGAGPPPTYVFKDAAGKPVKVADLKGKVVVMNLWATWCAPCKIEMPTLAKLAADYQGQPVEVVTVSIDKGEDVEKARAFLAGHAPLKFYSDPEAKLPWSISPPVTGMPTTFIYGKDGTERGRVSGEADWAGPEAKSIINRVLAEG